jgi:hypothetical protein
MTLGTFTFKIKRNDMRLLRRIFSFTHKLENAAKFTLRKRRIKLFSTHSLHTAFIRYPRWGVTSTLCLVRWFVCLWTKWYRKCRSVVILITLSDWSLLPCYRQHKSNAAYVPVISKNDVECISGLRASPGEKMVGLERECKVIYEAFGYRFSSLTTWMRSGKRGWLQQLKELETAV